MSDASTTSFVIKLFQNSGFTGFLGALVSAIFAFAATFWGTIKQTNLERHKIDLEYKEKEKKEKADKFKRESTVLKNAISFARDILKLVTVDEEYGLFDISMESFNALHKQYLHGVYHNTYIFTEEGRVLLNSIDNFPKNVELTQFKQSTENPWHFLFNECVSDLNSDALNLKNYAETELRKRYIE